MTRRIAGLPGRALLPVAFALLGPGCANIDHRTGEGHLEAPVARTAAIPAPVTGVPVLPPPQAVRPEATFSTLVTDVPVNELLFALSRDAGVNIDIHPGVSGRVTLNAIDQTLMQILDRIAAQVPLRYHFEDKLLVIEPDQPYLYTYRIDYVNLTRSSKSQSSVATQIATTGQSGGAETSDPSGNSSITAVESSTNNRFWETLKDNIAAIVADGGPDDAAAAARNVIVNRETGLLTVRATQRQQRTVQAFLDQLMSSAQRQVLIEATVVEVELSNQYQFGVDWSRLANDATGLNITQDLLGTNLTTPPRMVVSYGKDSNSLGNISATVRMLEQFGNVKVLSSPKIMAINNQTALLKVVDNVVYFTVESDTTALNTNTAQTTFTTTPHTIPVGFVMSVTPQISRNDAVTLNVRPTISRVTSFVKDPNPSIAAANLESLVPQIQVRELESVLQVQSGQLAVLGGLIQDSVDLSDAGIPGTARIAGIGDLLNLRDNTRKKSELVVFLRPRVISGTEFPRDVYADYLPKAGEPFAPQSASDKEPWR